MDYLQEISRCVEIGKLDKVCPHPPELNGKPGVLELTRAALEQGMSVEEILERGLIAEPVGVKFDTGECSVADVNLQPDEVVPLLDVIGGRGVYLIVNAFEDEAQIEKVLRDVEPYRH